MSIPKLKDHHPKLGNRLTAIFGRCMLRLIGWRMEGHFPEERKMVICLAPHTSNWDFFVAIFGALAMQLNASWMGKKQIFAWPVKSLLLKLGGIPVDRAAPGGLVQQVVEQIRNSDSMIFALAPEGTRKRVPQWKNGFLRIAKQADVPVYLGYFDAKRKVFGFHPKAIIVDDPEQAMADIRQFYQNIPAIHPENTN